MHIYNLHDIYTYLHIIENYSVIKNEIKMLFAAMWMEFEDYYTK